MSITTLDKDTSKETRRALSKTALIVEEFRRLDPEMQAQTMAIFLAVAEKPGQTLREIEQRTGHSSSTVSRNIAALGQYHRKGREGHDVLRAVEDIEDRRTKRVTLTRKGEALAARLAQIIEM